MTDDYHTIRSRVEAVLQARAEFVALILALQPFEYFDSAGAYRLLEHLNAQLLEFADCITNHRTIKASVGPRPMLGVSCLQPDEYYNDDVLARAFLRLPAEVRDNDGEFSPGRVFAKHYLKNAALVQVTYDHLDSLGIPPLQDPLIAMSIVGWICDTDDPIRAFCTMDSLLRRLDLADEAVVRQAISYFDGIESIMRQARRRINRALKSAESCDTEEKWLILADVYKRLVEGPVRRYGWLYHCLMHNQWRDPPMLAQVRDKLSTNGGWIGDIARQMILTHMRNSEAHEQLAWDGIQETFIAGDVLVDQSTVLEATISADAFARGSEAALVVHKSLSLVPRTVTPDPGESGRLSPRRRAEAFFGTNGIEVLRADFNSVVATITCASINQENINPCFQALICCHVLLPDISRFDVRCVGGDKPCISVSAGALARTLPTWELAVQKFTSMPLCTFLVANFDARRRSEDARKAVRSVAWIAVDDLLDTLDGSSDDWQPDEADLVASRINLNKHAIDHCLTAIPEHDRFRLAKVRELVAEFAKDLQTISQPVDRRIINGLPLVDRFRTWWSAWGPVQRLPGIVASVSNDYEGYRPALRGSIDLRWSTM